MSKQKIPTGTVETVRKILAMLNPALDQLPGQVRAATSVLASIIGFGKELKEELNDQELRAIMDQLALIESELENVELDKAQLPANLIQGIKAFTKGLILALRKAGYPYAYPAYRPPFKGYPTYFAEHPSAQKYTPKQASAKKVVAKAVESTVPSESKQLAASAGKLVESATLGEALEGTEGLEWMITLIEAGLSHNRKLYRPEVLQVALQLFEGLSSYADHPSKTELNQGVERSIRDLAGWVTNVKWDTEGGRLKQGAVVGIYHALNSGPVAPLLHEAWMRGKPDLVQFSILGEGRQQLQRNEEGNLFYNVEAIDRLFSLDAVAQGAAGGRVDALIASVREEADELKVLESMTLEQLAELRPDLAGALISTEALGGKAPAPEAKVEGKEEVAAAAPLSASSAELSAVTEQLERMQMELALANRQRMLSERVSSAALPDPVKDKIREDFEGRIFDEDELDSVLQRESKIWTNILREKPAVSTISVRETRRDRFVDAIEGMIEGEDVNGVPRFHSVHQAYCTVKGLPFDTPKHAIANGLIAEGIGFDPVNQVLREAGSITTATWTAVFGTAMQRKLIKDYKIPVFDEWKKIVSEVVTLSDFKAQLSERVGYYGLLPIVNEGGTYQPLTTPAEEEASYDIYKRGGLEDWTWEAALNDDLGALKKIPKRLALAAKITLFQFVFDFLRLGSVTATTYDAPRFLFQVANHANLGAAALTNTSLTTAKIAMRTQTALDAGVTYLAIRPKYLVVPNELEALAIQLRDSVYIVPTAQEGAASANVANPHRGTFEIIVVDYWTDNNNWFLVADPDLVPTIEMGFLGGKEEPDLLTLAENTGSHFSADKIVFKVRQVFGGVALDHRGLYASEP